MKSAARHHTASQCKDIVLALLGAHGAMSLRDLRTAGALERESVEQAVNSLRKAGLLRRIAPAEDQPRAPGRYELTGKTLRGYQAGGTWDTENASFAALQTAWGISPPRDDGLGYVSRVIRVDQSEQGGGDEEIPAADQVPTARRRRAATI